MIEVEYYDQKVVKRHYPREVDSLTGRLHFHFDADPNLFLVKNNIAIHFTIELDKNYIPCNGFASKQFGKTEVAVNSQIIDNSNSNAHYMLADYLTKLTNYDPQYVMTAFQIEGYYDEYNFETLATDAAKEEIRDGRRPGCFVNSDGNYVYELIFLPTHGFFLENKPLPLNTDLSLTLYRLKHEFSTIFIGSDPNNKLPAGEALKITDAYAMVEYVSSPSLRNHFARIKSKPISYKFNDTMIKTMALPKGRKQVQLLNVTGGNTPAYMFFGLIKTDALFGSDAFESTNFSFHQDLTQINVTLNGQSLHGYPQKITNQYPILPYWKFQNALGRISQSNLSYVTSMDAYKSNAIFAHEFEGEEISQGWLSFTFDFNKPLDDDDDYHIVIWSIVSVKLTIDEHKQVEKTLFTSGLDFVIFVILKKMFVTIKSFTFRSHNGGGFFKVKGSYIPGFETHFDYTQPATEINLRMFEKTAAEVSETFATLLSFTESHQPASVNLTSESKQSDWEREHNIPASYTFRFSRLPNQSTPMQSTPIQPTPIQPTPIQPTPIQPTPIQPTPIQPTPMQPSPIQPSPIQSTPIQSTPIQPSPIQPSPIQSTPRVAILDKILGSGHPISIQ
ncbi:Oidioi.mRNA.OKI2018_I69.chr1.g2986.t1.cds [Oikopleura dioica]|uniref:Oidioi.mRNA.OKI2018_I69.chr1.g2986.t1.cds n=1 Tax=Oikopleura dioica TaxID=34765 RepID=A0ABN7SW98_OIKDI|nr:Oidioi.mRNA.OKI2018_I69.chr1.g2986.t1.cds [Oikopleura dioica]